MYQINDDYSVDVTRGDVMVYPVKKEGVTFKLGDIVRIKVTEKKNCDNVVLQKSVVVNEDTDTVSIELDEKDTKIGKVISKPVVYWYEIELNPFTHPQTIVGYDEDGAKTFTLYPEGADTPEDITDPEDIPVVDTDFDLTSPRPVANFVITGKFNEVDETISEISEAVETAQSTADEAKAIAESAGSGEAQDVSNGYKNSVQIAGTTLTKITGAASVRHKLSFKSSWISKGTCYVLPHVASLDIDDTYVDVPVPSIEGLTVYFLQASATGKGQCWQLLDENGSVIKEGATNLGLARDSVTLTANSSIFRFYAGTTPETSVGVSNNSSVLTYDYDVWYNESRYTAPKLTMQKYSWDSGRSSWTMPSVEDSIFYVVIDANISVATITTLTYNADINTIIGGGNGGGGSDVTFTSGTITIPASGWSPFSTSNYSHTYDYSNTCFTCPVDKSVKLAIVDIADGATLAQRKAAEQACIYGYYYMLGGPDMGMDHYDCFFSFGITSDTVPSVDIPVKYTVIVG